MERRLEATVVINRPTEEVFAVLPDEVGFIPFATYRARRNDPSPGVGAVYAFDVKIGGIKTRREFQLTEFEPPTRIRWTERSNGRVVLREGGFDLASVGDATWLTAFATFVPRQ